MFQIKIITEPVSLSELRVMAEHQFGSLVKAVVNIETGIMAIGGEMHADEEAHLMGEGSKQQDLWGINIYPDQPAESRVEFDSMINIRPYMNNRSRSVENIETQKKILSIVEKLVKE